jgi:hypothetical protein
MAYTLGGLDTDARNILNDIIQSNGSFRYSDQEIFNAMNDAFQQIRYVRPDACLGIGLRNAIPQYNPATDMAVPFPLPNVYYPAVVFYVVGRIEVKDDTFADEKRAPLLMAKFKQMLLSVAA